MRISGAKKVHYESGPNMTPLVDVVMVILIFLMLTGSFGGTERYLTSNVPITARGVGGAPPPEGAVPDTPLQIQIKRNRANHDTFDVIAGKLQMTMDGSDEAIWKPQLEALTAQLVKMRQDLNAAGTTDDKIQVEIHPQRGLKYGNTIRVFEAVSAAEFKKVSFAPSHP